MITCEEKPNDRGKKKKKSNSALNGRKNNSEKFQFAIESSKWTREKTT